MRALTLGADDLLVSHDDLSCGPLPSFHSLEQWRSVREEYWFLFASMPRLLRLIGADPVRLGAVQFTRVRKPDLDAWGLALLDPEQLKQHPPREALSVDAVLDLERTWEAITCPDPIRLLALLSSATAARPLPGSPWSVMGISSHGCAAWVIQRSLTRSSPSPGIATRCAGALWR
ncbi:MAG: hypothetical protein HY294_11545 [Candidatus Rokubacteria bacterium]|nr:hypothetical protein [Candidatus Rokubacteria bacterium]MBI3826622.1 hypothetical protein [Candidatus Rokubacteria bacterium]